MDLILSKFSILFLFSTFLLMGCATQPPIQEMSDARFSLNALIEEGYSGSEEYGREVQIAQMLLDIAEDHIWHGNFELAQDRAIEARNLLQRIHNELGESH